MYYNLLFNFVDLFVTLQVVDDADTPLQGVLLSLSGGRFRSNNLTNTEGIMVFSSLGPDQYFLRALMKEYKFVPGSQVRFKIQIYFRNIQNTYPTIFNSINLTER